MRGPELKSLVSIHSPPNPDVRLVQDRPDRVLGHARLGRLHHAGDASLADGNRVAQGIDFFRRLDAARALRHLPAVDDRASCVPQEIESLRIGTVNGESPVAGAMRRHQVEDLRCPDSGILAGSGT